MPDGTYTYDYSDMPPLVTVDDAASLLRVCTRHVAKMCKEGTLQAVKVGKAWRINRDALLAYAKLPVPVRYVDQITQSAYQSNPKPPARVIAEESGHKLVVSRFHGDCYDQFGGEKFYLFKYETEASAIARWKGWLRSIGVD